MPRSVPAVAALTAVAALALWPTTSAVASAVGTPAVSSTTSVRAAVTSSGTTARAAVPTSGATFVVNTAATPEAVAAATAGVLKLGGAVTTSWPQIGVVVGVAPDAVAAKAVAALRRTKGIVSAGVSGKIVPDQARPAVSKAKPVAGPEVINPGLKDAHVLQANAIATGKGVTVGIADSGTYEEHDELAGRVDLQRSGSCVNGGAFTTAKGSWRPVPKGALNTHGTGVAGVVAAATDHDGTRGVAPDARIAAIRVVNDQGDIFPEAAVCAAMTGALNHLPIVNHSYGVDYVGNLSHTFWDPADKNQAASIEAVTKAFAWSRAQGTLNVAGAGNGGEDISDKTHIPLPSSERNLRLNPRMKALLAEVPSVLTVSESDPEGTVTFMSTVGLGQTKVSAIGTGQHLAVPGELEQEAGTSYASPFVAGVAALVKQTKPSATPDQIETILTSSARPRTCTNAGEIVSDQPCRTGKNGITNYFGHGQVDALTAVKTAKG